MHLDVYIRTLPWDGDPSLLMIFLGDIGEDASALAPHLWYIEVFFKVLQWLLSQGSLERKNWRLATTQARPTVQCGIPPVLFFSFFSNIYPDLRCQQRLSSFEEQRCYKAIPGRRRTCRPSDEFDAFHLQSGTHGRAVGNDEGGAWRTTSLCYSRASHRRQELQEYHWELWGSSLIYNIWGSEKNLFKTVIRLLQQGLLLAARTAASDGYPSVA